MDNVMRCLISREADPSTRKYISTLCNAYEYQYVNLPLIMGEHMEYICGKLSQIMRASITVSHLDRMRYNILTRMQSVVTKVRQLSVLETRINIHLIKYMFTPIDTIEIPNMPTLTFPEGDTLTPESASVLLTEITSWKSGLPVLQPIKQITALILTPVRAINNTGLSTKKGIKEGLCLCTIS